MTADRAATERLMEATLAEHVLKEYDSPSCTCGWDWDPSEVILPSQVDFDSSRYRLPHEVRPKQHRAHVAAELLAGPVGEALAAEAARAEAAEAKVARVEALVATWPQRKAKPQKSGYSRALADAERAVSRALAGPTEEGEGER